MIVIPAVDLREGACVQLVGGEYAAEQVRLDDPLAVAREWARLGFRRLHVVDLDAATGRGSNAAVVEELVRHGGFDVVQVGGGVRDEDAVERVLAAGAAAVVVGTRGVEDPTWLAELAERYPGEIILAADVRERRIATRGWTQTLPRDVVDLVEELADVPLAAIMVTAVHREGQMQGTDLPLMEDVVEAATVPVFASGGVAGMHDLRALEDRGVAGVIVGMALYTGALDARAVIDEFNGGVRRVGYGAWDAARGVRRTSPPSPTREESAVPHAHHPTRRTPRASPPHASLHKTMSVIVRETKETQIRVELTQGSGIARVDTGEPFLDHMLVALARYAGVDLAVRARGDLRHHLIEDVAIAIGAAVAAFAPATAARYGDRTIPMDDALVHVALDIGGRPWYEGPLPSRLYDHWMRSFADNARATLHVRVIRGRDRHHVVEAAFKALGLALRDALVETGAVFSTKGAVSLESGSGTRDAGDGAIPASRSPIPGR